MGADVYNNCGGSGVARLANERVHGRLRRWHASEGGDGAARADGDAASRLAARRSSYLFEIDVDDEDDAKRGRAPYTAAGGGAADDESAAGRRRRRRARQRATARQGRLDGGRRLCAISNGRELGGVPVEGEHREVLRV